MEGPWGFIGSDSTAIAAEVAEMARPAARIVMDTQRNEPACRGA
jgi:hypothetical protein